VTSESEAPVVTNGRLTVDTEQAMEALGRTLASALRAGDLVVLTGDLGAGKTTLTRGIGAGLGVRGAVTSPTFVIARVHPAPKGRPALVHVDAYRLGSLAEVDDLDLDAAQEDSVTVVEWGSGLAEDLAPARLELEIHRGIGRPDDVADPAAEAREVVWRAIGERWAGFTLDEPAGRDGPPSTPSA
jgi:tRNA threonylcarbamoyladenosine biosynthesis protein TsaE